MGATSTLRLFDERRPSSEEAWRIVERIPLMATFRFRTSRTRHGGTTSRWVARWIDPVEGVEKERYIGPAENLERVRLAHEVVREELAEAQARAAASPELRNLRRLQVRAGARRSTRTVSAADETREVPILARRAK